MNRLCRRDVGTISARKQRELDLCEFRNVWTGPPTLRFHRCRPTASIGAYDEPGLAIRGSYCATNRIAVLRRITGGEVAYLDTGALCFTLSFRIPRSLWQADINRLMACLMQTTARALGHVGIPATFREPNEIEAARRRLGAAFITVEHGCVLYQGYLLRRLDVETLLKVVRSPLEKLSPEGVQNARERFTTLDEHRPGLSARVLKNALTRAFGRLLGTRRRPARAPARPRIHGRHTGAPDGAPPGALRSVLPVPCGVLRAALLVDDAGAITAAVLSGTLQSTPAGLAGLIARTLVGTASPDVEHRLKALFAQVRPACVGAEPGDLVRVVAGALARRTQMEIFHIGLPQANTLMMHGITMPEETEAAARNARTVLVPYCAKPVWCKWRKREGCAECGLCRVGEVYRLGREHGMRVVTVTNYEHLSAILGGLREQRAQSYVGMCCSQFYEKRHGAFASAGVPALLIDVSGANCYELGVQDEAYSGRFQAQSEIDVDVLKQVLGIPVPGPAPLLVIEDGQDPGGEHVKPGDADGCGRSVSCPRPSEPLDPSLPVVPDCVQDVTHVKRGGNVALEHQAAVEKKRIGVVSGNQKADQVDQPPADHGIRATSGVRTEAPARDREAHGECRIDHPDADTRALQFGYACAGGGGGDRGIERRGDNMRMHDLRNEPERAQQEWASHGAYFSTEVPDGD